MATIRKLPSGKWNAQVRFKGSPAISKSFPSKSLADKWVSVVESEMARGIFVNRAEAEATTLSDALKRYLKEVTPSKKGRAQEEVRIAKWQLNPLAKRSLASLKPTDFAQYRDSRLTVVSSSTVRLELAIISHLFTIAIKEWSIAGLSNPVEGIRKPKPGKARTRRLNEGEKERLLAACRQSRSYLLPYLVELAIETGMRLGELLSVTWDMVDFKSQTITLPDSKNGDGRLVPLSSRAISVLRSTPRKIDEVRVFYSWKRSDSIKDCWPKALERARIEGLHFHDLRHEASSRLFEKGLNVMEVASITGHKSLQMLKRYTHLKASDLVEKLG